MRELWRNIDGYKGMYQISSLGRVRSYKHKKPIILKPGKNNRGYLYVNLSKDGGYGSFTVHRLVAKHFLGKSNLDVNHKNGNKQNNTTKNLEWVSPNENIEHAKRNKLFCRGEDNGRSKLRLLDVRLIKYKHKNGKSIRCIAREMGISRDVVNKIIKKINWN